MAPVASALQKLQPKLQCVEMPPLRQILAQPQLPYTYDCRIDDVYCEPVLVLHSSGSTGRPKLVVMTHGTLATYDIRDFPTVPNRVNYDVTILDFKSPGSLLYESFPPFHIAGFIFKIVVPLYTETSIVFGPPLRPPSGTLTSQILQSQKNIRGLVLPPPVLEELYKDDNAAEFLKQLELVILAGGPLAEVVGNEVSRYTAVC